MDDADEERVEHKRGLPLRVGDKPEDKAEGEEGHRVAFTPIDERTPAEVKSGGECLHPPAYAAADNPAQDFSYSKKDAEAQADFFDQQGGRTEVEGENSLQGLSHLLAADEGEPPADSLRALIYVGDGLVGAHT